MIHNKIWVIIPKIGLFVHDLNLDSIAMIPTLHNLQDRIVQLFETNTYSVVNIFDVTLRPQLNVTGVVEVK